MKVDFGGTGRGGAWITVNVDGNGVAHPPPDITADITNKAHELGKHFRVGSIDEAQCIATLEHLPPDDLVGTLAYWRAFMKNGARLLVMVPDVRYIAWAWLQGLMPTHVAMGMIFCPPEWQAKLPGEQHRWGFDAEHLIEALRMAGWNSPRVDDTYPQGTFFVEGYAVPNLAVEAWA